MKSQTMESLLLRYPLQPPLLRLDEKLGPVTLLQPGLDGLVFPLRHHKTDGAAPCDRHFLGNSSASIRIAPLQLLDAGKNLVLSFRVTDTDGEFCDCNTFDVLTVWGWGYGNPSLLANITYAPWATGKDIHSGGRITVLLVQHFLFTCVVVKGESGSGSMRLALIIGEKVRNWMPVGKRHLPIIFTTIAE